MQRDVYRACKWVYNSKTETIQKRIWWRKSCEKYYAGGWQDVKTDLLRLAEMRVSELCGTLQVLCRDRSVLSWRGRDITGQWSLDADRWPRCDAERWPVSESESGKSCLQWPRCLPPWRPTGIRRSRRRSHSLPSCCPRSARLKDCPSCYSSAPGNYCPVTRRPDKMWHDTRLCLTACIHFSTHSLLRLTGWGS